MPVIISWNFKEDFLLCLANIMGAITYYLVNKEVTFSRKDLFWGIISKELIFNGVTWYLHYLLI